VSRPRDAASSRAPAGGRADHAGESADEVGVSRDACAIEVRLSEGQKAVSTASPPWMSRTPPPAALNSALIPKVEDLLVRSPTNTCLSRTTIQF